MEATFERALRAMIGDSLDFQILKMGGEVRLLPYLYQDQTGRNRFIEQVGTQSQIALGLAYCERLLVLSPKQPAWYARAASIRAYARDRQALFALEQRLGGVELDLEDDKRETLDRYAGKKDAKRQRELKAAIGRCEKMVAQARPAGKATLAVAATQLATYKMELAKLNVQVDAGSVVALAEEAHAAAPSSATRSALISALLFRASQTLARQETAYGEMVSRAHRSLGPSYLIAVALSRPGKAQEAAKSNPDVQRATDLVKETCSQFPDEPDPWAWAVLKTAFPDEAAGLAKAVLSDELGRLERSIDLRLEPFSAQTAFKEYWALQMAGKGAEALEVLKRCAGQGAPMPFDLP
jgi:hypothetical protein